MKKKMLATLLALCAVIACELSLSACSKKPNDNSDDFQHTIHTYDQKVIESKYLKSEADCTNRAVYYYSCECGKKGDTTFEYGELKAHTFTQGKAESKYLKSGADCTHKAVYYKSCSVCGLASDTEKFEFGEPNGHNFANGRCSVCGTLESSAGLAYALNYNGESYNCSGLGTATATDIIISDFYEGKPVTSIGDWAFRSCSSLTSIIIPDSVTSVGESAFRGCNKLIQTENGVGYVDKWAIACDTSITSVSLRSSTKGIGGRAFYGCSSLTSITIGNGVTSIGESAFSGCSSLTSITVANGNIKYHSDGNCLIETATKTLIVGCRNSIIPIDGSVTSIGYGAFEGCSGLTSITIPDSVTSIGYWAFSGCSSLTSITIPDGVTSIARYAFWGCNNLTSITIPNGVTSIGDRTFYGCSSLTSITFNGTMAQWKAIEKEESWNSGMGDFTVICTDGKLDKEGNEIA